MKQLVVGLLGFSVGTALFLLRTLTAHPASTKDLLSGYWKGRRVEISGTLSVTEKGPLLLGPRGAPALPLQGPLPPAGDGPAVLSGRLLPRRASPGKDLLPFVLQTDAPVLDAAAAAGLIAALWGAALVWAGTVSMRRRTPPRPGAGPPAADGGPSPLNPSRDGDRS